MENRVYKLKNVICIFILILLTIVNSPNLVYSQASNVSIFLDPNSSTIEPNDQFILDVRVDSGSEPFDTVDSFIQFDPSLIEVVSLTPDTSKLSTILINFVDNINGKISYSAGKQLGSAGALGNVRIASIQFITLNTSSTTNLNFLFNPPLNQTAVFYQGVSILNSSTGTDITIGLVATPTSTPILSTNTPTILLSPTPILGDADGDNQVTLTDFIIWKNEFISGSGLTSDFNMSQTVDLHDFITWKSVFIEN